MIEYVAKYIYDESMGLADYDLFLETAIGLLEETIEEK